MKAVRLFFIGCASFVVAAAFSVACGAEDLIVEDPGPAVTDAQRPASKQDHQGTEPTVYGWRFIKPADCGAFSYWDGQRCIDTRTEKRPANN